MQDPDRTASLMTPAKLAEMGRPKAAVSPAAWLDQMASDAGHQHVARLAALRSDLQAQAAQRDFTALAAELAMLAENLPKLDFGLLQPQGLLARLAGKSRSAGAEFASQVERIESAAQSVVGQGKSLHGKQGAQASGTDLTLLEFEVEFRAIEKIIDQGARWLQDMRNQLKTRSASATDEAAREQVRQDAARCELLVARLKHLRSIASAAHQCQQQAQATAARRAALVQVLQAPLAAALKQWRARISPLAAAASEGRSPGLSLEGPMEAHRDMQLFVKQAAADCGQLQAHEKSLAEGLQALGVHLRDAS